MEAWIRGSWKSLRYTQSEYSDTTCAGIKTGMEQLMEVQHMKGVATRHGPESCVPVREDSRPGQLGLGSKR